MTETLITLATRADGARRPGWVGRPLPGVQTRVLDDDGATMQPGIIGHLQVRGDTLFDGYLHRGDPHLDAGGWFATGDAAEVSPDGEHRIVGRAKDDLIKSGGYRIGAGEVEAALLDHPLVREVAVIGVPDADLGRRIVAFVVAEGPASEQVLIDHVAAHLSAHKRPREVRFTDALPRNAMGKVQKARLADN